MSSQTTAGNDRGLRGLFALLLLLLLLLPTLAAAQPRVDVLSPIPGQPIFGATEIELQVSTSGPPITRVEIYFDNLRVGLLESPPWRIVVDAGQENREHGIEAVAHDASGATASTSLRTPRFQVDEEIDVDLQQLFVTVEGGGRRVTSLAREDFTILDDGVPQEIITFEKGDIPFTAALVLDASYSMVGDRLRTAVDGAKSFVQSMSRFDEAKVILFADQVRRETPFTSVPSILSVSLSGVRAGGGTALNDALYLGLKRLEGRLGRKVLVLLSDGVDIESVLPMARVRDIARRNQVVLYWLRLRPEGEVPGGPAAQYSSAWRDAAGHQREMDELSATIVESGGRIQVLDGVQQVKGTLAAILRELRDQYVIGYSPSARRGPGTWHEIDVQVRGDSYRVRAQEGYLER